MLMGNSSLMSNSKLKHLLMRYKYKTCYGLDQHAEQDFSRACTQGNSPLKGMSLYLHTFW